MLTDDLHADVALTYDGRQRLTGPHLQHVAALRAALARYQETGDAAKLEPGFLAARALIGALAAGDDEGGHPRVDELRRLSGELPEFGDLLSAAADEAGRSVAESCVQLWDALGLYSAPPRWTAAEHEAARMVFACACGPVPTATDWLQASLRRVLATRLAKLLSAELAAREAVWLRALGGRYGSLRHRCAPRTRWHSRGLAELLREDEGCHLAVTRRLERWVAAGCRIELLAEELEAAVVHARTPSRLA